MGSANYVETLNSSQPQELSRIVAYLNFDMVASPNYVFLVLNGSSSAAPVGSAYLADTMAAGITEQSELWKLAPFTGRSDYGPFLKFGIPAGGIETGADLKKTMEERRMFGGLANAYHDPCYHQVWPYGLTD